MTTGIATRVIERPGEGRILVVQQCELSVVAGPAKGQSFKMEAAPVCIGSGEQCELRIEDPSVSKQHVRVVATESGFMIEDLGSTNGTMVAGIRIERVYVSSVVDMALGDTRIRLRPLDQELEVPLSRRTSFGPLIGHSDAMRAVFNVLERVADQPVTVLIEGESGTGKELVARALHEQSERSGNLLIAVDCSAIPANLIESELFGHVRGAFTGADKDRAGPFEVAEGGTVFLDEIGELPLELQPRLLRALESREIRRVGETTPRKINTRIVAATNRRLEAEVEAGRFREDLYYRLSVVSVRMPALRERREEVPRLVAHFRGELGADPSQSLPDYLMAALNSYDWPGNVRELRNAVQRLTAIPDMPVDFYLHGHTGAEPEARKVESSGVRVPIERPFHEGKQWWVDAFEREYLKALLDACGNNVSEVARVSGLSRQSCHRLIKRHDIGA